MKYTKSQNCLLKENHIESLGEICIMKTNIHGPGIPKFKGERIVYLD